MSPPNTVRIYEIGAYWSDEDPILCLESIQNRSSGASLPSNVYDDINPFLNKPEHLPEGIWYFVYWKDPRQAEVGLWKAKGDPCQIYSDSLIIGWRTTLEFYQGHSPSGNRTDWVMQEYSISDKGSTKFKGGSSLCHVFRSDREGEPKKPNEHQANESVRGQVNLAHDADSKSSNSVNSKLHAEAAEMERFQAMFPYQGDDLLHADCFAEGDFLELRDLDDPQSSSSSSDNSSCVTPSSDMYFDSDALVRELDDEAYQTKSSSNKLTISRPNDVVFTVVAEGSPPISDNNKTVEPVKVEASAPALPLETRKPDKPLTPEDGKTRPKPASNDAGPSSSKKTSGADKGKKVYRGKTIKKFLCFLAF